MRITRFVVHLIFTVIITSGGCTGRVYSIRHDSMAEYDTLNIRDFGALGDGSRSEYPAMKLLVDSVNKRGGDVVLVFPPGVYRVDEHNDVNNNFDLRFVNCSAVHIIGHGAIISINGSFMRRETRRSGKHGYSALNQPSLFYFQDCDDVSVFGLEINGNVQDMNREKGVVERGQGLLTFSGCLKITLRNVYLHHSPSDGIYIGPTKRNSSKLTAENVKCLNNARQGMSITGLRVGVVKNSVFSDTGVTSGDYGFHAPGAGIDIEPRKINAAKTGDIEFYNCVFENNIGGQFICTKPTTTSNIRILKSTFKGNDAYSRYELILAADSVLVDDCDFWLGEGNIFPTWKAAPGSRVTIQNSTIRSSLNGILSASVHPSDNVVIKRNKLIFEGDTLKSFFPYLQTKNLEFIENDVFIPSKAMKNKRVASLVQRARLSRDNVFRTDSPGIKPTVSYKGAALVSDTD